MYKNKENDVEVRVKDLLSKMTLEEKIAQLDMFRGFDLASKQSTIHRCSVEGDSDFDFEKFKEICPNSAGFVHDIYSTPVFTNLLQKHFVEDTRLGIPAIFTAEALHGMAGLRGTIFPVPLNLGSTFDKDIVNKVGSAIGTETRSLGFHEILAPNLDVARDSRWGRTEETFGEDTYLSSEMGVAIIKGEQKGDISRQDAVVTEPKHFCVHGIPANGINCAPAFVGKREVLRDYLPVFENAIKRGGSYNVMASYNSVDGDVLMCSKFFLTDMFKNKMNAKGYVRSDWGGINKIMTDHKLVSTAEQAIEKAINGGLDVQGLDQKNEFFQKTIKDHVTTGKIDLARIDDAVSRVLWVKFDLGLFENPYTDPENYKKIIRSQEHKDIALKSAQDSIVLLKNDGCLPLSSSIKKIVLIGPSSNDQKVGGYSGIPNGYKIQTVLESLKEQLPNVEILQTEGCAITEFKDKKIAEGQYHLKNADIKHIDANFKQAVDYAKQADVVIFVGGDNLKTSGESKDRCDLFLSGKQAELINELSTLDKELIVVLEHGKGVDLTNINDNSNAIVAAGFLGEFGAKAIVDVLLGNVNPSGRLTVSFPNGNTRTPCYYSMLTGGGNDYMEGSKLPLYPFGYGLSYTTFDYSNLNVKVLDGNYNVEATVDVKNTGKADGATVVQLYINDIDSSVVTAPRLLKGFEKVFLKKGETKTIKFNLDFDSFKLIDIDYKEVVEPGDFEIIIGTDAVTTKLSEKITL